MKIHYFSVSMLIDVTIVRVLFVPFLRETVSQETSWYSVSYNLSATLTRCPMSHKCRTLEIDVSSAAGLSMILDLWVGSNRNFL